MNDDVKWCNNLTLAKAYCKEIYADKHEICIIFENSEGDSVKIQLSREDFNELKDNILEYIRCSNE